MVSHSEKQNDPGDNEDQNEESNDPGNHFEDAGLLHHFLGFFALTFALSVLYSHKTSKDTGLRRELLKQQTAGQPSASVPPVNPAAPAVPAPGPPAGLAAPCLGKRLHAN